jgi:hypothetical protein
MPEAGESAPKTSDFFWGVVDSFAVILPGSVLAFCLQNCLVSHPGKRSDLDDAGPKLQ